MWVASFRLINIKSYLDSEAVDLDKRMNVFIGPNNAGKSVILRALYLLQSSSQQSHSISQADVRYGTDYLSIYMNLKSIEDEIFIRRMIGDSIAPVEVNIQVDRNGNWTRNLKQPSQNQEPRQAGFGQFPPREPENFIYPFLAKRKVLAFEEQINKDRSTSITGDFRYLVSKIDRISNPYHPAFKEFEELCQDIIGLPISTITSVNGKQIGMPVGNVEGIVLESMGDGTPHLLALIADLCLARNKLFLIEELENDIHPKALKRLLGVIIQKSNTNQFVVSTHSNIVAKYLGSVASSKMYRVKMDLQNGVPTSIITALGNDPDSRRAILEELGYEMTDYDLWKGWLILEESSAERLINDFFVPTYVPKLSGKLRTIAAGGVDGVIPKFRDFERLFLFTHLVPQYKNRAWVLVDSGAAGQKVIDELRAQYTPSGWNHDQFLLFSKSNFEEFYPDRFRKEVDAMLAMPANNRRVAKKTLLERVLAWIGQNKAAAKDEFARSGPEVIDVLAQIAEKFEA